ncbi:MAG: UDP-N-acetylglucosamine--N-acetylmuramyl-(pentapeptide) pyrophosphoryl-undecaprenol N-acetylglucosamine transferase [Clostridia bacterium]|nr:UDP-N-acetylglucosamine--N-acetylmuramyl-(pentapeptide) pyrophosphoryl-undecaprenol N-acetylglucosamine transferase [Clostridia bacterium]
MRILMAGGGTAGHINPAIAIADKIRENESDSVIEFIGTKRGMENDLVSKAGYKLNHIEMRGFQRKLSLRNVSTIYYYFSSPPKARRLIKAFRPDAVIATGGYLSWPLISAAHSLGIPSFIHESNAKPGKAVDMLKNKVNVIYTNYEITASYLKNSAEIVRVGNPLLHFSAENTSGSAPVLPGGIGKVILSFGGSLGAEKLTDSIIGCASGILKDDSVYILHSAGVKKFDSACEAAAKCGIDKNDRFDMRSYIYDMPAWLKRADVVICRAGAMTLSELAAYRKPAIVIPSPYVADNHQYVNAKTLADHGAAILLEEKDLTPESLSVAILSLLSNEGKREDIKRRLSDFAPGNAAQAIYDDIKRRIE